MKTTMADIAKRIGVNTSTVSLALRNSPKISEARRDEIRRVAKEMGYQVNPYVAALMKTRRTGKVPLKPQVIALVTASRDPESWKSGYNPRLFVEGCETVTRGMGVRMEHFWIGDQSMTARHLNEIFLARGFHGAVLLHFGAWRQKLRHVWKGIATVSYGVCEGVPTSDWVTANHYANMERVLIRLKALRFERIGFAMETPYSYDTHNPWLAVYLMEQYEQPEHKRLIPWVDENPTFEGFKSWFERVRPSVIICVRPERIIEWAERMGLRVPEDISLVTVGTAKAGGAFSGIVEKSRMCGKFALEMLFERIHRNEFGSVASPHHITVSGGWNRGKTLRHRVS